MVNKYATQFDVEYDFDIISGKPTYIIHLCGKDGCLVVGDTKKKTCEIRCNTLDDAKARCLEIRLNTQDHYDLAQVVSKEIVTSNKTDESLNYVYRYK